MEKLDTNVELPFLTADERDFIEAFKIGKARGVHKVGWDSTAKSLFTGDDSRDTVVGHIWGAWGEVYVARKLGLEVDRTSTPNAGCDLSLDNVGIEVKTRRTAGLDLIVNNTTPIPTDPKLKKDFKPDFKIPDCVLVMVEPIAVKNVQARDEIERLWYHVDISRENVRDLMPAKALSVVGWIDPYRASKVGEVMDFGYGIRWVVKREHLVNRLDGLVKKIG